MLDGYLFIKDNHPLNVKRGGVGLYIKDSFPATNRPDIVSEIQLNRKSTSLQPSIEVPVKIQQS